MPRYELQYPKDAHNVVKRYGERGTYALRTIHQIVNSSRLLHISFNVPDSPFPVTLPMIGQMGSFARPSSDEGDVLDLYLHGYISARMMNLARGKNSSAAAEADNGSTATTSSSQQQSEKKGLPVCVAASHVDGLVLALSPFSSSYNYRSAVLFGHAEPVTDESERLYAMRLITDSVVPGRWDAARQPPTPAELQSTGVLRVAVRSGSAKVRRGGPHEEARDARDAELCGRVWTGVVPVHETVGEPIPGPLNPGGHHSVVPAYIADYRRDANESAVETALLAAVEPEEVKEKGVDEDD